ncbi:hypothetical protein VINI7043_13696 [Vibrio nigripulchritudo ATCC 27043]|uniref:substrate-binding periplasmic protein n=1 Tax=Vibrio nigripulchritudo TaxID=28173 RepID=UPI00021C14B4|nr:transporter substrate-binding domain-containing protein [Vibrio nigripulchritudo]EGU59409.1 hypothetical protein VINI7043_13696 [Vibrio nigripulchritudo ATCC 27043]
MHHFVLFSLFTLLVNLFVVLSVHASNTEMPIRVCGKPWAPYFYLDPNPSVGERPKVQGINIELFNAINQDTDLDFLSEVIPWKRCLHNTEKFSSLRKHEVATDATYNASRGEKYHFVGPIYSAPIAIFYSRRAFPNGVINPETKKAVTKVKELKHFEICGMAGWNYEIYTSKYGIPQENIITTVHGGLTSVMKMLQQERCQILETQVSIVAGSISTGKLSLPKDIRCQRLIEKPVDFYLMISRQSPRAKELVTKINASLVKLKTNGDHQTIFDTYMKSVIGDDPNSLLDCL